MTAIRRMGIGHAAIIAAAAVCLARTAGTAGAAGTPLQPQDAELPKLTMPEEFAMVFTMGYVDDHMPKEPKQFEYMLTNMKRTGINTVMCKYTDWRHELCKKHGVMMMIDLAVPEHDLKQAKCAPEEAEDVENLDGAAERFAALKAEIANAAPADKPALEKRKAIMIASNVKYICKQVKGSKGVWGYGLYYDNGTHGSYLNHAAEKLRLWDPSHVTYVGSYRHGGLETVTINPGCYGWYDFHWARGTLWHYLDMKVLHDICGRRNAISGNFAGYDGVQQDLFTVNTCIASGVKMMMWFIGGPIGREPGSKWNDEQELVKVAAEIRTLYKELMLIGHPSAYYSTPVTKTHDNKPVDPPAVPRWCDGIPADCWMQATSGEALIGLFKYKDGTDALFVANQNTFAPQTMALKFTPAAGKTLSVDLFNRKTGQWKKLPVKDNAVSFDLAEARGELLKVKGAASK